MERYSPFASSKRSAMAYFASARARHRTHSLPNCLGLYWTRWCAKRPRSAPGAAQLRLALSAHFDSRGAMQVGLDRRGAVAKAPTVDREVLHDALDIVARLREGNPLNPIDGDSTISTSVPGRASSGTPTAVLTGG